MRGHRAVSAIAYAKILLYPLRLQAAGGTTETDARPLRSLVILERGGRRKRVSLNGEARSLFQAREYGTIRMAT